MKRMFITGATGFIGTHLCRRLVAEGVEITAYIRPGAESSDELARLGVNQIKGSPDLCEARKKIMHCGFDGIIHLATCYIAQHEFNDIDDLVESNILFPAKLLDIAVEAGVPWFINTGTLWQNLNNQAYSPANFYAATKQSFEDIAKYYVETGDIRFVTLKLNDSYGPDDTRPKVFNLWEKISATGEVLEMSKGEQLIDIVHVDDIVQAFFTLAGLLSSNSPKLENNVYSVTSGKPVALRDLARIYQEVTGKKLNIQWGAKPYRKREIMVPCNNIPSLPGWKAEITLEEGLRSLYQM